MGGILDPDTGDPVEGPPTAPYDVPAEEWPDDAPPPRDDVDADRMGEPDDEIRLQRWRAFVRRHPRRVSRAERKALGVESEGGETD